VKQKGVDRVVIAEQLKNNIEVLVDRRKLKGFLNDILRNELSKINVLLAAYDIEIIDIIDHSEKMDEFLRARLVKKLMDEYSIVQDKAEWSVSTWLDCIDSETLALWRAEKQERVVTSVQAATTEESTNEKTMAPGSRDKKHVSIEGLLIPCGVGKQDHGFVIRELENRTCNHPYESIYAVIFNYLQRNITIDEQKEDTPTFFREHKAPIALEYRNIYRLMMILLAMVKHGYANGHFMPVSYDGDIRELKSASDIINNYSKLLCNMAGISHKRLLVNGKGAGTSISLTKPADVYCIDFDGPKTKARTIWYAPKINYAIVKESKETLTYFLREISEYKSFRPGQFEVLEEVLTADGHTMCIMPTGSGKSFIFYLASLLEPNPTFVVCPTDLLIQDQIRNLKEYHRIDDACHLEVPSNYDFTGFEPSNKLIYLTPETFQNSTLLKRFITLNHDKKITAVVLDEIHCISNWSHDFRPEYLMLSTYLNRYLDRTYFHGFTATANYSVVKDISEQLDIDFTKILSPVELRREQFSFRYYACEDEASMYRKYGEVIKHSIFLGKRTLVFIKDISVSYMLLESMGEARYEADIFDPKDPITYHFFAEDKTKILIANSDIGVGVNLPGVTNVIHFGLPISKGEYVQEIGRAGRNGENVTSHVIFQSPASSKCAELTYRDTSCEKVIDIIANSGFDNDYISAFRKIIGEVVSKDVMYNRILEVLNSVKSIEERGTLKFPLADLSIAKKCLYVLFVIGYVFDWCVTAQEKDIATVMVLIKKDLQNVSLMRRQTREYFYKMGAHREYIARMHDTKTLEDIIEVYTFWYYDKFLYHHKEQFVDMVAFCEAYQMSEAADTRFNEEISGRLASYFSLAILEVSEDEAKFSKLSLGEIMNIMSGPIGDSKVSNIERLLAGTYSEKLDFAIFTYMLFEKNTCEIPRLRRILSNLSVDLKKEFLETVPDLYKQCNPDEKFRIMKEIAASIGSDESAFINFLDGFYRRSKRDHIFYGILAQKLNVIFGG